MEALTEGKFYRDNFTTNPLWHGPMRRVTHGSMEMWLDQWGANYLRDGTHWGHRPESASNLDLTTERDDEATGP